MIKKIIFNVIAAILYISTTVIYSTYGEFDWKFTLVTFLLLLCLSFAFWRPDFIFHFTHWYLDRELEECSDVFIFLYKAIITVLMFAISIISLWKIAPIEL